MRVAVAAGLTIAALLYALVGPGSPPAAQPGRGDAPAAAASVGPDDVVVEDWQSGPLGQKGVPSGWEAQTWGKASGLDLSVVLDEGSRVLHLASHNDRTTITRDLHGRISLARTPILRWRWKVIAAPTGGDARRRETADQAAQLYVTWPRPPALLRSRIIGYAWDTSAPAGSRFPSQKTGTVTYVILRSGTADLGRWVEERRDVRADFRAIYGEDPSDPGAITLSIDSNDTHSRAESLIGPIRFSPS
ncbi:MAG TPA: DUF3047 domain-containing protein [Methylomirabilota bacterium]|nr:DUF3047 domain-containing protein [Methylomirabilota bacterium]